MSINSIVATSETSRQVALQPAKLPDQRLAQTYRFRDPDMDLFFTGALGWGYAGGLTVGEAFYVAPTIVDRNADSWIASFSSYGDELTKQADSWKARGWIRSAGEMRLKAFASYRSAWQFAAPGDVFTDLFKKHQTAFKDQHRRTL